jgi:hypothetical protein
MFLHAGILDQKARDYYSKNFSFSKDILLWRIGALIIGKA